MTSSEEKSKNPEEAGEDFVMVLLAYWDLSPEAGGNLLGKKGAVREEYELKPDELKTRVNHLREIRAKLGSLFRDKAAENEWLRKPDLRLGWKTPLELLMSDSAINRTKVREHISLICGLSPESFTQ